MDWEGREDEAFLAPDLAMRGGLVRAMEDKSEGMPLHGTAGTVYVENLPKGNAELAKSMRFGLK